jgi:hypothetical protein
MSILRSIAIAATWPFEAEKTFTPGAAAPVTVKGRNRFSHVLHEMYVCLKMHDTYGRPKESSNSPLELGAGGGI